jgi:hypothetical protein
LLPEAATAPSEALLLVFVAAFLAAPRCMVLAGRADGAELEPDWAVTTDLMRKQGQCLLLLRRVPE